MALTAADTLQDMMSQQHSGMLNQMMALNTTGNGGSLAGGLLARGGAVAGGILPAVTSMAGLDPFSMGMRAGTFAFNRMGMGLMGAGAIGMGTMAGVGLVGAGLGLAGSQMMQGAQTQLALNRGLSQNFNFMNSQGGMGFTSNQGNQIGDFLRSSAGVIGQSGEIATFGELSKLASNMGRMGMAQNVRTVQEFKTKFKEMVDTLKTVAHDLGTSLEEAQKMMVSMKSSGIFNKFDQIKMSHGMRAGALAGGLAMSEMSSAASIGSQISRSIGGLGRQGAFAGMKTMEQIGVAQKIGAISEEDIYNATGQTGAEGRQALAAAQMQQSASFLQSGRGRRFLASIAGKNGTLNMDAVNEYMAGGDMTTGRTMELAQQNLSGVGRANFIRNEGRLRGAALEKFGGLAQAMVYKQWLSSRGYTPDDMDDRAMLAFQRFSGMGRDEADIAIKQVQTLPQQLQALQETEKGMRYSDMMARQRKTTGIEGMKRKWEHLKEDVQGKLQNAGAKLLEHATDTVEGWFNNVMGVYTSHVTEGIEEIASKMELGGAGAKDMYRRHFKFGMGGGVGGVDKGFNQYLANQDLKMAAAVGSSDKAVADFGSKNAEFVKLSALGALGKNPQDALAAFKADLAQKAGSSLEAKALLDKFQSGNQFQQVSMLQTLQESARVEKQGQISSQIDKQVFSYTPGGSSTQTEAQFKEALGRQLMGATEDQSAEQKFAQAGFGAKLTGIAAGAVVGLGGLAVLGLDKLATLDGAESTESFDKVALTAGRAAVETAGFVQKGYQRITGVEDVYKGAAGAFQNKATKEMIADMYAGDDTADRDSRRRASSARSAAMDYITRTRAGKDKLSDLESGEIQALAGVSIASRYQKEIADYQDNVKNGRYATADQEKIQQQMTAEYNKMTGQNLDLNEAMKRMAGFGTAGKAVMDQINSANYAADVKRVQDKIRVEREKGLTSGYLTVDAKGKYSISAATREKRKGMSTEAQKAAEIADKLVTDDLTKPIGDEDRAAFQDFLKNTGMTQEQYQQNKAGIEQAFRHKQYYDRSGQAYQEIGALSTEEKRKLAKAGGKAGEMAAYEIGVEDRFKSLSKGPGGQMGALAKLMGISLSKEELEGMAGGRSEDIGALLGKANITDRNLQKQLTEAMGQKTTGGKAAAIDALMANMSQENRKKLQDVKASSEDPQARATMEIRDQAKKQTEYLKQILLATNTVDASIKSRIMAEDSPPQGPPAPGGKK